MNSWAKMFSGRESGGAAGQIEGVGPDLFSALLLGTEIDAVWVAELQRRPGSHSTLSSMLTLLTRCPLASPLCVGMSVWECLTVRGFMQLYLRLPLVCAHNCLCAVCVYVCVLCVCVAAVCPPPVCLWDNQPLSATTETEGTGQECLSATAWWMPRRTHTHTHEPKEHT